jgi:hypothetical protein
MNLLAHGVAEYVLAPGIYPPIPRLGLFEVEIPRHCLIHQFRQQGIVQVAPPVGQGRPIDGFICEAPL